MQLLLLDQRSKIEVPMWNDTDVPLAHLITFRCYGTWLHGDSRGSIDRFHNRYLSPYIEPNKNWHRYNTAILEGEPVTLDASRRRSVEAAILETCTDRKWQLHAQSVRTNHVHTVVSIGLVKPALALIALKAHAFLPVGSGPLGAHGLWSFADSYLRYCSGTVTSKGPPALRATR